MMLALVLLVAGLTVFGAWATGFILPGPKSLTGRDPATGAQGPNPVSLVVFGTSLSARGDWPLQLGARLAACTGRSVETQVIAGVGQTSAWGVTQIDRLIAAAPDLVVMEFVVNDVDLRDGLSRQASREAHRSILEALAIHRPDARVLVLAMNPTHGVRGAMRWRTARYLHDIYVLQAEAPLHGFHDLRDAWHQMIVETPGGRDMLIPDGLHPEPEAAAIVIVQPVAQRLAALWGQTCPPAP